MACTVLLELKVKPDSIDTLKGVFKEILVDTRAYDGCIELDVVQDQDDPTTMVIVESWETRAKYEKYLGWRGETGALEQLGAMCSGPPNIRYFDRVDV